MFAVFSSATGAASAHTITDSNGQTWTLIHAFDNGAGSPGRATSIWKRAAAVGDGSLTVTGHNGATSALLLLTIIELSGTSNSVDVDMTANSSGSPTSLAVGPSPGTPSSTDEYVIVAMVAASSTGVSNTFDNSLATKNSNTTQFAHATHNGISTAGPITVNTTTPFTTGRNATAIAISIPGTGSLAYAQTFTDALGITDSETQATGGAGGAGVISIVQRVSQGGTGVNHIIANLSSPPTPGNVLVFVAISSSFDTSHFSGIHATSPANATLRATQDDTGVGQAVYTNLITGGESSSYQFDLTGTDSGQIHLEVLELHGIEASNFWGGAVSAPIGTNVTTQSVSGLTTQAGDFLLACMQLGSSGGGFSAWAGGYSELSQTDARIDLGTQNTPSAGTMGATSTWTTPRSAGTLMLFNIHATTDPSIIVVVNETSSVSDAGREQDTGWSINETQSIVEEVESSLAIVLIKVIQETSNISERVLSFIGSVVSPPPPPPPPPPPGVVVSSATQILYNALGRALRGGGDAV